MGHVRQQPAALLRDRDELAVLQPFQHVGRPEPGHQLGADRLAVRHELQDLPLGVGDRADAPVDQLSQPGRDGELTGPPPQRAAGRERPRGPPRENQLAQEQRVSLAHLPETVHGLALDLPAERP